MSKVGVASTTDIGLGDPIVVGPIVVEVVVSVDVGPRGRCRRWCRRRRWCRWWGRRWRWWVDVGTSLGGSPVVDVILVVVGTEFAVMVVGVAVVDVGRCPLSYSHTNIHH